MADPSAQLSMPIKVPEATTAIVLDERDSFIPTKTDDEYDESLAMGEEDFESFEASQNEPASSVAGTEEHQIQAFAKLEFADGDFYMTTYAIELGRDPVTPNLSHRSSWHASENGSKHRSASSAAGSVKMENDGDESVRESIEGNGLVNGISTTDPILTGVGRLDESLSIASSSQWPSQRNSSRKDYNALAMSPVRDMMLDGPVEEFNLTAPLDCPLIPIQQPAKERGRRVNGKSISRRHIRISFNFEKHYFEILFLGRNGGFLDDEWFAPGDIQPLVNGSVIQIGGLGVRFILPDVPPGETGADEIANEEEEEVDDGLDENDDSDDDEDDDEDDEEEEDDEDEEPADVAKISARTGNKAKVHDEEEIVKIKRKGPGRPPKNGIMSKREQAQLAREAREKSQSQINKHKPATPSGRGKGKTAKALELEQSAIQPSGKRKYTKRKRAGGEVEQTAVRESSEKTESMPPESVSITPKAPKEKRPPKPPRSPSPVWDESKLTPEQLAKPQASYVILIHEALTNSKTGAMSLPQIYRAIERKYPYFKLKVTTQGWQSSVRHNLGQHAAFRKIERDGKGWLWGYDPEVSIEKEKKRRATPPPPQPRYYPPASMQQPRPHPYPYSTAQYAPGRPPPNGQNPYLPMPYGQRPNLPPNPMPPRPPYAAPGFPIILNANSDSTYRSPYERDNQTDTPSTHAHESQTPSKSANGAQMPQNPASQPHYPNYPPAPPYPQSSHNWPHPKTQAPHPPYPHPAPLPDRKQLSRAALDTLTKFKQAMMDSMTDKTYAARLIESAVERTLSPRTPSRLTDAEDLRSEQQIMIALERMLGDVEAEASREGGMHDPVRDSNRGTRTASERARDVVKTLPAAPSTTTTNIHAPSDSRTPHPASALSPNNATKHPRSESNSEERDGVAAARPRKIPG